jgi:hypothetical protein
MDKAQRLELIRKTAKAKLSKWQFIARGPSTAVQLAQEPAKRRTVDPAWGLALSFRWGRRKWLETPTENPEKTLGDRNRQGVSPLAKIADKYPRRLPRM